MVRKSRYTVGLDVGSSKTCAVVCEPTESGKLGVLGVGVAESRGWRKGLIVNLDVSLLAVKKAVEAAESAASVSIESAYVGIGGPHVKGVNSRGAMTLGKSHQACREVTREDIPKVIGTAQKVSLPADRELIHVLPQEFLLDSQDGIRDPVGMLGARLEVNVHLITASAIAAQNVVTAVNRAGIVVLDTVFEPLASAEACLTADERELGVALADIGAESTGLIVYSQGTVRHTAMVPVGGEHFTNDIAVGLRTPIPEAEKMKKIWGEREADRLTQAELEVPSVGGRPARMVSYSALSGIIEPRSVELLELVQAELARSGYEKQLGAGVVLVGGGAKLGGLATLAEQTLGLPVRIGRPKGLEHMGEILPDPAHATVVGLVVYGNRIRLMRDSREKGFMERLLSAFRGEGSGAASSRRAGPES